MLAWQPPHYPSQHKKLAELEEPDNDEVMSDGEEGLSWKVKDEKEFIVR